MNFSEALEHMKRGLVAYRNSWSEPDLGYVADGDEHVRIQSSAGRVLPHLLYDRGDGTLVPWAATHEDILADDWETTVDD